MKKIYLSLLFVFFFFSLAGCQSANEKMSLLDNIKEISISESGGYGGINDHFFTILDKKETRIAFETIMKTATLKNEAIDKEKPDYDIVIHYENRENHLLHLILGKDGNESILMYVGHENKRYFVPPEATTELRRMIYTGEQTAYL